MIRFREHPAVFLLTGLLVAAGLVSSCFASEEPVTLDSIEITPASDSDTVEILSSRTFTYVTYTLPDPPRLVVDPMGDLLCRMPDTGTLGGRWVKGWRVKTRTMESGGDPSVDYLELEMEGPAEHQVQPVFGGLLLRVRPQDPKALKAKPLLPPTAEPYDPPSPFSLPAATAHFQASQPAGGLQPEAWTLDRALDYGISHHRPVRIAWQEVELAQMKVKEARRAIYPAATLKASWTQGTASEVMFDEYTAGLQMEHPLYYSGRLTEAYRQSLVNLQVAEKRQHKTKSDYAMEVSQEYYQLIGAKVSQAAHSGLIEQAEEFMTQAKQRFDKGLLTRLELLNVEAQVNQARFQRANAENDLSLARFKFLQRLGLGPEALVDAPAGFSPPTMSEIDLEEVLQLAARYRPDIQVNSLLVKFHEHEERIAKAKQNLKVDLSGFIGQSAAAFETEPLDAAEDYFVGIKATKAWGPHSTTGSATTTKTSPKLGQTTRTDSTVYSGEVGIYDQLAGISEIKQAQINLNKARRELEEAKNTAFQEAHEAYISYNKAKLQLHHAKQKIAFREEQVKILKAQAGLNEALPSQVIEAVMKLNDERVGEAQALSSYHVALAKLNKAVGLAGHYK